MAETGFTHKDKRQKLDTDRAKQTTIKGIVLGDALICLAKALGTLGLPVKEVSTSKKSPMGATEAPFVHHISSDGVDIPFGSYSVESLGLISCMLNPGDAVPELGISVVFERGANDEGWVKLLSAIREQAAIHKSLFHGRAIKLTDPMDLVVPRYIDCSNEIELFLNGDVEYDIATNLFTPITDVETMKALGLSGHRGVLLYGQYGTGKTLIAYEAARRSVASNRTFVLCNAGIVGPGIEVSRLLQPSLLFIEDMDSATLSYSGLSKIRNTLSGVDSKKDFDVITILTTNFLKDVEKMDRSLLRPDRVDAIIEVAPPDQGTVARIVKKHGSTWLDDTADFSGIYRDMAEAKSTPATIVEMLKRAKIHAFKSGKKIDPGLLRTQFQKMQYQIHISSPQKPSPENTAGTFARTLREIAYEGSVE